MRTSCTIVGLLVCLAVASDVLGQQTVSRFRTPQGVVQRVSHQGSNIARVGCNSCGGADVGAVEMSGDDGVGSCSGGSCSEGGCSGSCASCTSGCGVRYGVPAINCQYAPMPQNWCRRPCQVVTGCDPCCRTIFDEMACDVRNFFGQLHGLALGSCCTSSLSCTSGCDIGCCDTVSCASSCRPRMFPVPARSCALDLGCGCASTGTCDSCSSCSTSCCSTDCGCSGNACFQELLCSDGMCARPSLLGSLGNILFGGPCEIACNDAWGCTESCSTSSCEPGCGFDEESIPSSGCDSCAVRTVPSPGMVSQRTNVRTQVARSQPSMTRPYPAVTHNSHITAASQYPARTYPAPANESTQVARTPAVRRISHPARSSNQMR